MQTISGWWPLRGRSQECCLSIYPCKCKKMKDSFIFKIETIMSRTPKKRSLSFSLQIRSEKWIMENETLVTEFVSVGSTNRLQLQVVLFVMFSWSMWPLFWETSGWSLSFGWILDFLAHELFSQPLVLCGCLFPLLSLVPRCWHLCKRKKSSLSLINNFPDLFIFGQCVVIEYFLLTSVLI